MRLVLKKKDDIIQGLIPIEKNSQLTNRSWGLTITDEDKEEAGLSTTEGATSVLVDLFTTSQTQVNNYKKVNKYVFATIDVGIFNSWHPDADDIPIETKNLNIIDFTAEIWFKTSKWKLLKPVMEKRVKLAKKMGFNGIEVLHIDIPNSNLTTLKEYAKWLAEIIHKENMSAIFHGGLRDGFANQMAEYYDALITKNIVESINDRTNMVNYAYKPIWMFEESKNESEVSNFFAHDFATNIFYWIATVTGQARTRQGWVKIEKLYSSTSCGKDYKLGLE